MRAFTPILSIFATCSLLVACGDAEEDDSGHAGHGHTETCGEPGDTYAAGMEQACEEGDCSVVLVSADPAPPDKGDNTWVFQVIDGDGAPMTDLSLVEIEPYMPEHDHGTNPLTFPATADDTGETWTSDTFNLFMGGLWEIRVHATSGSDDAAETHTAIFTFCAEA